MQQNAAQSWKHLFNQRMGSDLTLIRFHHRELLYCHIPFPVKYITTRKIKIKKKRGKIKDSLLLQYSPKSRGCMNTEGGDFFFFLIYRKKHSPEDLLQLFHSTANSGWSPSHQGNAAIPKVPISVTRHQV